MIFYVSLEKMVLGKSTLIKSIVGLVKPQKGEIIKNAKIGYLPQKNDIQKNFPASIEEVVLSGTTTIFLRFGIQKKIKKKLQKQ